MKTIGVDVGGTKILAVRYNDHWQAEASVKIETEAMEGRCKVLENLCQVISTVRTSDVKNIGVAMPGFINRAGSVVQKLPNIPAFEGFDLGLFLEKETGLKVIIGNDARLFALAEQYTNAPQASVLLGIIIGTGVGSGLILKGEIFNGAHNFAGEIGHQCFNNIEVESIISGPAIAKHLGVPELPLAMKEIISDKSKTGLKLENQIDFMGQWLANLVLAFDPEEIVIGGGAGCNFWCHFESLITRKTNEILAGYPVELSLRFSKLRNPGSLGAAILTQCKR